jgi:hypothetical protein
MTYWIAVLAVATSLTIGWFIFQVARSRRRARNNLVPYEVRALSHEVANEATKVSVGLRKIAKSPDPKAALIHTLAGHKHES